MKITTMKTKATEWMKWPMSWQLQLCLDVRLARRSCLSVLAQCVMPRRTSGSPWLVLLTCLCVLPFALVLSGQAARAEQPLAGAALAEQEKQWQNCEGGYYTGPRPGRRNYSNDQYLWVVTPAFAKRFCMPESMVSNELKGAEAIAFKMVDAGDSERCGVDGDGSTHCSSNSLAHFEIYLSQSLNLPAAHPEVQFFENRRDTSDWHLAENERNGRGQAYRKGQYSIPQGRMRHFGNPYGHPDDGFVFGLIYAHEGKGRWPVGPLWEVGYRGGWVKGLDMLILESSLGFGFGTYDNVAKARSHGYDKWQPMIVMDKRNDPRKDAEKNVSDDYAHVIYLPRRYMEQIRQAVQRRSGSWDDFISTQRQR